MVLGAMYHGQLTPCGEHIEHRRVLSLWELCGSTLAYDSAKGGSMGIEDRDYYREEYAKKTGMRYNKRSATYSKDPTHWREDELAEVSRYEPGQTAQVQHKQNSRHQTNELSFIGKLFTTIFVMLICAITYRYLR